MKFRQPQPTENKLLLLYILRALGSMSAEQINRLCIELNLMDYIDLQLSIAELMDGGLMTKFGDELGVHYLVSAQGKDALGMFEGMLPASRLACIQGVFPRWREILRQERHLRADWTYRKDSRDYSCHLRVIEGDTAIVDITLTVATAEEARLLCAGWPKHATEACSALFGILQQDGDTPDTFVPPAECTP